METATSNQEFRYEHRWHSTTSPRFGGSILGRQCRQQQPSRSSPGRPASRFLLSRVRTRSRKSGCGRCSGVSGSCCSVHRVASRQGQHQRARQDSLSKHRLEELRGGTLPSPGARTIRECAPRRGRGLRDARSSVRARETTHPRRRDQAVCRLRNGASRPIGEGHRHAARQQGQSLQHINSPSRRDASTRQALLLEEHE